MIGKTLKRLRGKKTQEIVSRGLGISRARYSHYENDHVQPDNEMLRKIAEYYEVSSDYILGVDKKFEDHLERVRQLDPFLIFQLIKTKTDDEIINEYRHQAEGKDIDEETVRAHLNFVRYLESQKNQKK